MQNLKKTLINMQKNFGNASHFPHYSRFINAITFGFCLKSIVFLSFYILFLLNLPTIIFPERINEIKINLVMNPDKKDILTDSIERLIANENYLNARYISEVYSSKDMYKDLYFNKLKDVIYLKNNSQKIVNLQIQKWRQIIKKYPKYRDAYSKLSMLYLKMGEMEEARKNFEVARQINPNWPELSKFNL
jgi:tetratricopeptide (TPR) repeat protein